MLKNEELFYLEYQNFFNNIQNYVKFGKEHKNSKNSFCNIDKNLWVNISLPYIEKSNEGVLYIREKCPPYLYIEKTHLYFDIKDIKDLPSVILSDSNVYINLNEQNLENKDLPFIVCKNLQIRNCSPVKTILGINHEIITPQKEKLNSIINKYKLHKENKSNISIIKNNMINKGYKRKEDYSKFSEQGIAIIFDDVYVYNVKNFDFINCIAVKSSYIENTCIKNTIINSKNLNITENNINYHFIIVSLEKNIYINENGFLVIYSNNANLIVEKFEINPTKLKYLEIFNCYDIYELKNIEFSENSFIEINGKISKINLKSQPFELLNLENTDINIFKLGIDLNLVKELKFSVNKNDYIRATKENKKHIINQYVNVKINKTLFEQNYGDINLFKEKITEKMLNIDRSKLFHVNFDDIFQNNMVIDYVRFNNLTFGLLINEKNKIQYIKEISNYDKDDLIFDFKNEILKFLDSKEKINTIIIDNVKLNN